MTEGRGWVTDILKEWPWKLVTSGFKGGQFSDEQYIRIWYALSKRINNTNSSLLYRLQLFGLWLSDGIMPDWNVHGRFNHICQVAPMWPHLIHASLDPLKSISQMTSWSVKPFLHSSQLTVPMLYNWPLILPSKLPHHTGDLNSIDECDSPNAPLLLRNGRLFCIIDTFVLSYDFLHDFADKGMLNVLAGALPQLPFEWYQYIGRGKGSWFPCQYIDTTRKAIDCATTLPLTVFI